MSENQPKYLAVKNWEKFQQYKDRNPPWIKLHRSLFEDYEFSSLAESDQYSLIKIWILASTDSGTVPNNPRLVKRLCRMYRQPRLSVLVSKGFLLPVDAKPERAVWGPRYISEEARNAVMKRDQSRCKRCGSEQQLEIDHIIPVSQMGTNQESNLQVLCRKCNRKKRVSMETQDIRSTDEASLRSPETEIEVEVEAEKDIPPKPPKGGNGFHISYPVEFDFIWKTYPRKDGKGAAWKAFQKINPTKEESRVIAKSILEHKRSDDWLKDNGQFVPHLSTYLNQRRWEDEEDG